MPRLVALAMPAGPEFVRAVLRAWDHGDAVFPLDGRLPTPHQDALLAAMAPSAIVGPDGTETPVQAGQPVADGDALVVATSGTTGEARAAILTHAAVAAAARITSVRLAVDRQADHWLACLPLAHIGGLSVVTRALLTGTRLTVLPAFDALTIPPTLDPPDVRAGGGPGAPTLVSLVPAQLGRVSSHAFRVVLLGGSAPPDNLPANVVTTYGMTETGGGVVYDGIPLDGVDVSFTDSGEILLRTPTLARCYRRPGGEELPLARPDGFYETGDCGHIESGGRLRVLGRSDDMIVTGGENVWPSAVEAVISNHPAVNEVAIAGRPDPEWGQRVVAFVVPVDGNFPPTLDDLRKLAKQHLAPWAAPKELVLVETLPRTALGKLRRAAI